MKLSAVLPKGRGNGLAQLDMLLCDEPSRIHAVIILVDAKKLVTDIDTGEVEATARIVGAEFVDVASPDYQALREIQVRATEARLGPTLLEGAQS